MDKLELRNVLGKEGLKTILDRMAYLLSKEVLIDIMLSRCEEGDIKKVFNYDICEKNHNKRC